MWSWMVQYAIGPTMAILTSAFPKLNSPCAEKMRFNPLSGLMRSGFGKFIVAGRFMRVLYAVVKACAFSGLVLIKPFALFLPELWAAVGWLVEGLTYFFVYLSVALCLLRGLPVIAEFVYAQKRDILGGAAGAKQ